MVRRVFFSFDYETDLARALVVKNNWTLKENEEAGFINNAEFERIKRDGRENVKSWIDKQLVNTRVTVVLIGSETLDSEFAQYGIQQSYARGNALIAIKIGQIKNLNKRTSFSQSTVKIIGRNKLGELLWFDEIIDAEYDYIKHNGFEKLEQWVEQVEQTRVKKYA